MDTNDPIKNKRCLVVERVSTNLRFPQNKAYIVSYLCIAQDIPIYNMQLIHTLTPHSQNSFNIFSSCFFTR